MAVRKNLKLIFSHFALNIKKEWQYKTSFFMQIIMMMLNDLFFIIQWLIVFDIVDSIGGYGFNEVMLLWAVTAGGYGFSHTFFNGAWKLSSLIYECNLDVYLTQPKNTLINVCSSYTSIAAIGDMIYAFVVLFIIQAPWYWFLIMIPAMILSGLLIVAVQITFVSLCFVVKRGDAVARNIQGTMVKAGNYPSHIFSLAVKAVFFTIIPTFFFAYIPAEHLFINFNIWWVLILVAGVALWIGLAFLCFYKGLKRYSSGSVTSGRI
ncbi:MAG: ABC-2 family transporter protein [Clostridia bacterium]|nr:ABC-2 family transporter protein [Clostridia bacterium]